MLTVSSVCAQQTITRDAPDASESEGDFRERNDESLLDRISEIAASL